ncbi:MAG TPA: divalent-cation tolerance protein CutA [Stellaceae bacterium]|nr:divalent-cation tolerance protein CutA [Stellaceae bacterium]
MAVMIVYVTASDANEARRIGRTVVEERLAACANILGSMNSIYWWEGKVEEASEAVLILKTTEARLEALVTRVKALHSYDCPCIEAWPAAAGYRPFLDWVTRETHGSVAGPDGTAS